MVTRTDRGWAWVVMIAAFCLCNISGYLQWSSGIIYLIIKKRFDGGTLETSWVSALFLSMISFSGPIASIFINKFNCRTSMMLGSLILTTGIVSTAFVTQIMWTFVTFGALAGTGLGICYNTGLISMGFNFDEKRNIACGVAVSGGGVGPFLLTPLYQFIYNTYGYTGFFLLLGGLSLQICIIGALLRESEIEISVRKSNHNRKRRNISFSSYIDVIKSPSMLFICIGYFFADISIYLVYVHFPDYCMHTSSSTTEVSMFLSLAGISGCVCRLLFGLANNSRNIDEHIMLFGVFSLLGFFSIIFQLFSYSVSAKIIYACALGGYSGCCWAVLNTILIHTLGNEKLAVGTGYLMLYVGLGTFTGPPLAGMLNISETKKVFTNSTSSKKLKLAL